jgi:hypothetical protein
MLPISRPAALFVLPLFPALDVPSCSTIPFPIHPCVTIVSVGFLLSSPRALQRRFFLVALLGGVVEALEFLYQYPCYISTLFSWMYSWAEMGAVCRERLVLMCVFVLFVSGYVYET